MWLYSLTGHRDLPFQSPFCFLLIITKVSGEAHLTCVGGNTGQDYWSTQQLFYRRNISGLRV